MAFPKCVYLPLSACENGDAEARGYDGAGTRGWLAAQTEKNEEDEPPIKVQHSPLQGMFQGIHMYGKTRHFL
jgi:hypothetical protein